MRRHLLLPVLLPATSATIMNKQTWKPDFRISIFNILEFDNAVHSLRQSQAHYSLADRGDAAASAAVFAAARRCQCCLCNGHYAGTAASAAAAAASADCLEVANHAGYSDDVLEGVVEQAM